MPGRSTSQEASLTPKHALLHPLWLGALALLMLNDHLLKGLGLLPGALTGKLSDIAGMLVAPTLLAVLLRVKSSRGVLFAHLATGVVFAGINLSPHLARGFEGMMALTPFPWVIWVDPSDLLVLPLLLVSWVMLTPWMTQRRETPRYALMTLAGLGTLACMATSPPDEPPDITEMAPFFADTWGHLGIENATEETLTLRVRQLHSSVFVDCGFATQDPTAAFSRALFGQAEYWEVEPGRVMPIMGDGSVDTRECKAYLIDGGGLETQLLFFDTDTYNATFLPSTSEGVWEDRTLTIFPGESTLSPHPALFEAPPIVAPEAPPECEPVSAEDGLAWSELPPMSYYEILAIEEAPDGCMKITLSSFGEMYLCLPRDTFPFESNELVLIRPLTLGEDFGTIEGLEFLGATKKLRAARGQDLVPFDASTTLSVEGTAGCDYVHDACGNLTRPLSLRYGGPSGVLAAPGDAIALGTSAYVYVVRAFDLPIGDTRCLPDSTQSDRFIESVYVSN